MGAYCLAEDVQILLGFPNAYSALTQPTLAQVNNIIIQVTATIDVRLKRIGITSQPTDTDELSYLKMICTSGAACRIGMTKFGNTASVDGSQPAWYCKEFSDFMNMKDADLKKIISGGAEGNILSSQVTDGAVTEKAINGIYLDDEVRY